ncbi:hypothetical protein, partial [Enterobacter hormaechei]|uniref:hypothetical protein n=1 Tax=Enterobacter hormaechei TaxID=158836 RepID=UPI0019532AE9
IFGVAAGVASISIDRHGVLTQEQTNDKKAIGIARAYRERDAGTTHTHGLTQDWGNCAPYKCWRAKP